MSSTDIPKVADVLDRYIEFIDPERVPDGKFHPSSLWMCDRQAVMIARGETQTNPPSKMTKRIFRLGHVLHELVQAAMLWAYEKQGETHLDSEFEVDEEHMTGHGDDALFIKWLTPDEEVIVYEYKTSKTLSRVRREGKPQDHHLKQGATYCAGLAAKGHTVKELHVVYFQKNDLDIEEFVIPYNPEWRVKLDEKVDELSPYLDQPGVYPACTGEKWAKGYCPFYPICHQENPTEGAEVFSWK